MTVLLLALSPAAFRGEPGMRPAAYLFGLMMAGNGLLHLVGSIYMKKAMPGVDRKSTRLNSSHSQISYAVFCLKKKKRSTLPTSIRPDLQPHTPSHLYP